MAKTVPLRMHCPHCDVGYPLEAGFRDADGKRLAAILAMMDAGLGRAVVSYLRLFKPGTRELSSARAAKVVQQLAELVDAGTVCRDERGGVRRPATPAMWAEGIEQMLHGQQSIETPLANHNYLRAVVFALADKVDANRERKKEQDARVGRHRQSTPTSVDPILNKLAWLDQQLKYEAITREQYEVERASELAKVAPKGTIR